VAQSTPSETKAPTRFLTQEQVSEITGISIRTLEKWRLFGQGPRYRKLGAKAVRYESGELQDWLASCPTGGGRASWLTQHRRRRRVQRLRCAPQGVRVRTRTMPASSTPTPTNAVLASAVMPFAGTKPIWLKGSLLEALAYRGALWALALRPGRSLRPRWRRRLALRRILSRAWHRIAWRAGVRYVGGQSKAGCTSQPTISNWLALDAAPPAIRRGGRDYDT